MDDLMELILEVLVEGGAAAMLQIRRKSVVETGATLNYSFRGLDGGFLRTAAKTYRFSPTKRKYQRETQEIRRCDVRGSSDENA